MNAPEPGSHRLRAFFQTIVAVCYIFLARTVAEHAAQGLVGPDYAPLVQQAMLAFLLLLGFAGLGSWLDHQRAPIAAQGFPRREGFLGEWGMGLATGWAIALAAILPLIVIGGIAIVLNDSAAAWGWLAADIAFFALLALAEEIAFRGYAFQRLANSLGPVAASLAFAAFYALVQALVLGSSHASVAVSIMLSLLLSTAYLRTRALWLGWGLNFGWKASRALLFGLAVGGINSHSPVVQGDPMGPFWITGGGFGIDGTWLTFFVLLAAWPVVYRVTRELDYRYNTPVIVAAGIAVDLDAAARKQHEAATRDAVPAAPTLVQILPVSGPVPTPVIDRPATDPFNTQQ
jgi:membrane protease YdiL (CAAX protease family)